MASIAEVFVEVLPVTGRIADGIAKALREADDDVRRAAKRWSKDIERELGHAEDQVDADTKPAEKKLRGGEGVMASTPPQGPPQGPSTSPAETRPQVGSFPIDQPQIVEKLLADFLQ